MRLFDLVLGLLRATVMCAVCVLALALCLLLPAGMAWAEEDAAVESSTPSNTNPSSTLDDPTNVVNPRQIPDNSFLYDTSIDELVQADSSFQGNYVQVVGEVVGDSLVAEEDPGHCWITLESLEGDSSASISVLIDNKYLDLIDAYGTYNQIGTKLQVRGTFYLTCPSHEGIMDIHAENAQLVARGIQIHEDFDLKAFVPGILLMAFGIALTVLYRYLHERER